MVITDAKEKIAAIDELLLRERNIIAKLEEIKALMLKINKAELELRELLHINDDSESDSD